MSLGGANLFSRVCNCSLVPCFMAYERLLKAVDAVKASELSYRQAAEKFNCPKSSIYDHVQAISNTYDMGRPNALTMEEEKDIVRCCEVLGRVGARSVLTEIIGDYLGALSRPNPFRCGVPGQKMVEELFKTLAGTDREEP